MKIAVVGPRGNLGQQLVKLFSEWEGNEVIALSRTELDITRKDQVLALITELTPDILINASAYNSVDLCEQDDSEYELAERVNGVGVGYLAEAALRTRALFVHYSTDYVFTGDHSEGYRETDLPHPINRYGASKLHGEKEVLDRREKGLRFYLIRTSKLFGPQAPSPNAKKDFFETMLELSLRRSVLKVVNEETACFTYTPDLARATRDLLESHKPSGIYHLCNQGYCTWYSAAIKLFELAGVKIRVEPVAGEEFPRPAARPKFSVLLNTKADSLRPWAEALEEYLRESYPTVFKQPAESGTG